MIRDNLKDFKGLDHDPDFRWRGQNVTRIENLSDIAFALALGMIISGAQAPQSFADLREFLFFLIPTAAAFAIMLQIWTMHYTFFRRYGVADRWIITLNAALIFVVLYLAYPLRFTFTALYTWIIGLSTGDYSRGVEMGMDSRTGALTICFFVSAFASCQFLMAAMYSHVLRKNALLNLNPHEMAKTRTTRAGLWWSTFVSLLVIPFALFTSAGPLAAFLLFLQSPGYAVAGRYYAKKLDKDEGHSES